MAQSATRNQRAYVQQETTWGVIPNTGGTATLAETDAFLFESLDMNPAQPLNQRPDKTGSLGLIKGTPGRKSSTWSMRCSLAGSGTAGTPPDIGPFLEALIGKQTVLPGTSVIYEPDSTVEKSLTIWDFNRPAGVSQRCIFGAIVQRGAFSWGDNFAMAEFSGEGRWVLDTDQFPTIDDGGKGGLTAFPAEPATPQTSGDAVAGYKGVITLDGQTYFTMRSGSIEITVARELDHQNWDNDYPGEPIGDTRTVNVEFVLTDDDSSALKTLKGKVMDKVPVDLVIQLGKTAGNIWTFNVNRFVGDAPTLDYGDKRRLVRFRGNATISAVGADDEISIVLT